MEFFLEPALTAVYWVLAVSFGVYTVVWVLYVAAKLIVLLVRFISHILVKASQGAEHFLDALW